MELIKNFINGKFRTYTEVRSPQGYCFYDVDEIERSYTEYIATPITDKAELERKFVLVEGNADELNEEMIENYSKKS
jgi:hypothetical protein